MELTRVLLVLLTSQLCSAYLNAYGWADGSLQRRQAPIGDCSVTDTCDKCFGDGYVVCSYIACYNPSEHQQCCGDGTYCVAKDNSCCGDVGPGVSGASGTVAITPPTPLPTNNNGKMYTCSRKDSGEECCQRGNQTNHWCSGEFPYFQCYNPTSDQSCCTNGVVCDGKDCCALVSAKPTSHVTAEAQSNTGSRTTPSATGAAKTETAASESATSATSATTATTATTTSSNTAATGVVGKMAAAAGVFAAGVGLVLL